MLLRDAIEKAKEISRSIRKGTLRSFSIGGQAISKKQRTSDEFGEYNEIDRLELHEVTICEKGINPEAKFDILKMEDKTMSEKLEKALEELNDLMKQVNGLGEEGKYDEVTKNAEYMDSEMDDEEKASMEEDMESKEDMDEEELKALDQDSTRDYEAGELVVSGGKPTAAPTELKSEGLEASDFSTLNLSAENVEKAYAQFKAEQMEKLAYDNLSKQFEARLSNELAVKKSAAESASYDARTDVAALKEEFALLRKSLSEKDETIRKSAEMSMALPEGIPTSLEAAANMTWDDVHSLVRGN